MKRVLLHICCGICAISSIRKLKNSNYYVEGLFFNPNIHPKEEYNKRLEVAQTVADKLDIDLLLGEYNHPEWGVSCDAYSTEKEGGRRCVACYELRLNAVFNLCNKMNFDYFTTTLTISPHKNSLEIIEIGKKIGGSKFLALNFKKEDGFRKTVAEAKEDNLYRQNYCGCVYSLKLKV